VDGFASCGNAVWAREGSKNELKRVHDFDVSRTTIEKVLRALQGRTPWQARLEKLAVTPSHDEVEANYDDSAERIRHPDYRMDLRLASKKPRNRLS